MSITIFRYIINPTPLHWEVISLLMRGFKSSCGFIG
ncbi:hypothetical protein Hesat_gp11c [Staphylococcus phage Hesat]|nr:hypothetical protein Hesat_gp11c [Staphylococcus phage Hesat]